MSEQASNDPTDATAPFATAALDRAASAVRGMNLPTAGLPAFIGEYRIIGVLGEGGMGTVYEAEQQNPRRPVALKVIRPALGGQRMERRFAREAEVLGRLEHPGIARIYAAGTAETPSRTQPYFAMELVRGRDLLAHAASTALDVKGRLALLAKVCDAVEYAHRQGVIHRDLKPSNVLVDESGQPKVLDFGVARLVDPGGQAAATLQTETGQLVGTLTYMSPEQASGGSQDVDARSDVYALGLIGYQLLADRMPYLLEGKSLPEMVRMIREEEPARLSSIRRGLRGDVETILVKAMQKEPGRRYATAAELAADIRRYLGSEPITARPPSSWYQFTRFARRNRVLVAGVAGSS